MRNGVAVPRSRLPHTAQKCLWGEEGQEEMHSCILKPLMPCPSSLRFGREFCGREPLPSSTGKVCDSGLEGS